MSIRSQIDRISVAKNAVRSAIEAKGVSVPEGTTLDGYAEKVAEIQTGTPLPDGGAAGQFLRKTSDGIEWADVQQASETDYGTVRFVSDAEFDAYMGVS